MASYTVNQTGLHAHGYKNTAAVDRLSAELVRRMPPAVVFCWGLKRRREKGGVADDTDEDDDARDTLSSTAVGSCKVLLNLLSVGGVMLCIVHVVRA